MDFLQKWPFFGSFFLANLGQQNVLCDISQQNVLCDIFPSFFGFSPKMAIFPIFFLGNIDPENVFYDILERKLPFLAIKTRSSKSRKFDIFSFFLQKWPFYHLFF